MVSLAHEVATKHPHLLNELSDEELLKLEYDWKFWARPNQLEPEHFSDGFYQIWMIMTGRGFGKNRSASEAINDRVEQGKIKSVALVAPTAADARDIVVMGDSGIVTRSKPWFKAQFMPSKRRVEWPNGAHAIIYSAEDPEQLRGHNSDFAYLDELASWNHLTIQQAFDNLMFGLRLGSAQAIITTTPRPIKIIRELVKDSQVYVTRGSTYENLHNLAPAYRQRIVSRYEGTRLGRQELYAELLDDTPGALWHYETIERNKVSRDDVPPLKRIAIGVDPAGSRDGHEVGIIAGGVSYTDEGYCLGDYSMSGTPEQWGQRAIYAYDLHEADCIVVETNFGGEMVANVIHNIRPEIYVVEVRASRGKRVRAEPVSMLSERDLIHHVRDADLHQLEDQLTTWLLEEGPNDRLDAYVWTFTELMPAHVKGKLWFV